MTDQPTQDAKVSQRVRDLVATILEMSPYNIVRIGGENVRAGNNDRHSYVELIAHFEAETRKEEQERIAMLFEQGHEKMIELRDNSPFHSVSHDALTTYAVNLAGWANQIRDLSTRGSHDGGAG